MVNAASKTIAVVDLNTKAVTFVLPVLQDTPVAVGINPVTGRALVAMQRTNYGVLVDLTVNPPVYAGIVSISTGTNTRVAVEPNLNWALATPGGLGSVGIVDLNQQSSNAITDVSRTYQCGYGHRAILRVIRSSFREDRRRRPNSECTISLGHSLLGSSSCSHF